MSLARTPEQWLRVVAWFVCGAAVVSLGGCGAAALPCRLTAATLKIVPVVGHAAATPFDMCASAID
ncbi:hypothetical protein BTH42_21670 [Burkholderia sp. SRS-W-2-2016]|uniref:DUF6726 family protein n=1 Tax=Burkholderia sp. SRS-W-2-2016 TaxID=1926878 RepID=UPI00094AFD10|nr:DUF6726 family protein [Burkholderia sp. SRS-W-2-2016]OLL29570.1 hypothetical protein BTH42_21670 [Burkholderia sp. SRS-W-2-2016]